MLMYEYECLKFSFCTLYTLEARSMMNERWLDGCRNKTREIYLRFIMNKSKVSYIIKYKQKKEKREN